MAEETTIWCSSCKSTKDMNLFYSDDKLMKTCATCRERNRKRPTSNDFDSESVDQDDEFTGQNYNYKRRYNRYKADDPDFDIPLDDFVAMLIDKCHYCGARNLYKGFNGIDRIDSTQPHIPGNCVPCCWTCNRMKSAMDVNDFMRHIKNIYMHLGLQNYADVN